MSNFVPKTGKYMGGGFLFGQTGCVGVEKLSMFCLSPESRMTTLVIHGFMEDRFVRMSYDNLKNLRDTLDKAIKHQEDLKNASESKTLQQSSGADNQSSA